MLLAIRTTQVKMRVKKKKKKNNVTKNLLPGDSNPDPPLLDPDPDPPH